MEMSPELASRIALITGASQGLGRHFAIDLAGQGVNVALVARNRQHLEDTANLIQAKGGTAVVVPADVTDGKVMESTVAEVEAKLGPIDILVNAAGTIMPPGRTWEADPDLWWRVVETNLKGTVNTCRAAARRMCARRRGRIINVASSTVLHGRPNMSAYVASKAAVVKLTEVLAAELAAFGVTAFVIHPGTVRTEMSELLLRPENAPLVPWFKKIFDERRDNPPEIGSRLVQYLASGLADDLSGRYFMVPIPGEITVAAFKDADPEKVRDANLLRICILPECHPEAGA